MKTEKNFSAGRNDFTKPRFSETSTGITEKYASARFRGMYHGFAKSDMATCGQDITPSNPSRFASNRILHHTAKPVYPKAHRLRCFHYSETGGTK